MASKAAATAVATAASAAASTAAPAAATAATTTKTTSSFFRITLHRSQIGMPQRSRDVLAALGLHKRGKTVFHPVHPQFAGMIMKVKELVTVQEVERRLSGAELRAERTPDPGFWLESKVDRSLR
ncbi:unnamed protein product [Discula destructiva]